MTSQSETLAITAERNAHDQARRGLKGENLLIAGYVPDVHCAIHADRPETAAIRTEGQAHYCVGVRSELSDAKASPHIPKTNGPICACPRQKLAHGVEHDRQETSLVAREVEDAPARVRIPNEHTSFLIRGRQILAV